MPRDTGGSIRPSNDEVKRLKAFRRQFWKAKNARSEFSAAGELQLQMKISNQAASASLKVPEEAPATRFHVAMRSFLNPADRLYFQSILEILEAGFTSELEAPRLEAIRKSISNTKCGPMRMQINDQALSAEEGYELIFAHFYIRSGENLPDVLRAAQSNQLAWGLMWFEFHSYALAGYEVVSELFDCIRVLEATPGSKLFPAAPPNHCIYCLRSNSTFSSEEHILPESLGNDVLILPRGIVCDECNNGVLSQLDAALLGFEPIALLRVLFTSATKSGAPPKARFQNMSICKTRPGHLHISAYDRTGEIKDLHTLQDGQTSFNIETRGRPRFDGTEIVRALYKVGLAMVAYDRGWEEALNPRYDDARSFIMGSGPLVNDVLVQMKSTPAPTIHVSWATAENGTGLVLSIYGMALVLNLERQPRVKLSDELRHLHFDVLPIQPQGPEGAMP